MLEQVSPTPTPHETGTFDFSDTGDVTAHAVMTLARTRTGLYEDGSFRTAAKAAARKAP